MNYTFHWLPAFRALPDMLWGALVTLEIAVLSMLLGVAFAILLALAAASPYRALRAAAASWIELARNTPALFQIYMAYFGLGSLGIHLDSFVALLAGITFNNAGIARAGLAAEMSLADIDALLDVNVRAVVLASQAAIPHLTASPLRSAKAL